MTEGNTQSPVTEHIETTSKRKHKVHKVPGAVFVVEVFDLSMRRDMQWNCWRENTVCTTLLADSCLFTVRFEKCTQGTDRVNSSMSIISTVHLYNTITRSVTELNVRQQYLSNVKINDMTYQYSQKLSELISQYLQIHNLVVLFWAIRIVAI